MTSSSEPAGNGAGWCVASAISSFDRGRDHLLLARKYAAMRSSPFSFMRGTCHLFYRTLPNASMPAGAPLAWLSGDLHVENFGTYKGDNRLTYFDVTDFDECVLAPLTLDVVRFIASIFVGATEWGISEEDTNALASRALVAYAVELATGKPAWVERENARGLVKRLFAQVAGRSRTELLDRVTTRKGKRRRLVIDDAHVFPASAEERAAVESMVLAVGEDAGDPDYFHVVDVARRIAGLGSIGMPRFIAIVEGRGSPDRNALLDIKGMRASALAELDRSDRAAWHDDAERVVTVNRHAVAVAPAFLQAAASNGASFSVRELQLADDRVKLKDWERQPKKVGEATLMMAAVAAWMHLRGSAWRGSASVEELGVFAADPSWRNDLLARARESAVVVAEQFAEFSEAYDAGYFKPAS